MQLVDIAVFTFPNEASILESLLIAENIPYILSNQVSATNLPGTGSVLSVNESDREQVVRIIKEAGFERFLI